MLEHLILAPQNGLCNRLRAIASARRICQRFGARCSVVWDWGDFWHFFAPMPDIEVLRIGRLCEPRGQRMHGVAADQRIIDVQQGTVKVRSGVAFWGSDEPRLQTWQLREFFPRLHPRLSGIVEDFAVSRLPRAVGMHIRRTDNEQSIRLSPDRLFLDAGAELVAEGKRIFLATDNLATERMMSRQFGEAIVTYPRRKVLAKRWPRRSFDETALDDDLLDLFLLARTEYILGCQWSSFSGLAMALNGSPLCRKLGSDRQPADESL
jgi:hypothetical protein